MGLSRRPWSRLSTRVARSSAVVLALLLVLFVTPAQAAEPPVNVAVPTIAGEPAYRERLTATPGGWTPPTGLTFTYQWARDGVAIAGATAAAYRIDLADLGHTLSVTVTATDATGTPATAVSAPTGPVARASFEVVSKPELSGVSRFTRLLTGEKPRLRPRPTSVRYRWLRDDAPLPGARGRTHRVGVDDVDHRLRLQVTVRREGYATERLLSSPRTGRHLVPVRRTVTYHVETRGPIVADLAEFRRQAQETYDDPRGWRAAGVELRQVPRGGDFTLVLASAGSVPGFSSICSSTWSCRVGRFVVINQDRWRGASPAWNAAGRALRDYRHMVVNHETGHWLGHGHLGCPRPGPAPVMMQQSKGRGACSFNPWPLAFERWYRR